MGDGARARAGSRRAPVGPVAGPTLPRCDRLIFAAGMPRSGSTWLFNAARLLSAETGGDVVAGWIGDLAALAPATCDDLVVKLHNADPKLAARANFIFTSRRDLRDVGASIRDMGWAKSDKGVMRQVAKVRRAHDFWAARADLDIDYRDILEKPRDLLKRLATILRIPIDGAALTRIEKELSGLAAEPSRMTTQHDALNLMHATHRFDGRAGSWRERLSPELAAAIVEEHGDWLRRYGFMPARRGGAARSRRPRKT